MSRGLGREFEAIRSGYESEKPDAVNAGPVTAGSSRLTARMARILGDHYMLWLTEWDMDEHGIPKVDKRGRFVPRRDESGHVVKHPPDHPADAWAMPVHEAVKRLRGRQRPYRPEYYWLRSVLAWRGLPCLCGHADIVEHVALIWRTMPDRVESAVIAAARECVRLIGIDRDPTLAVLTKSAASTKVRGGAEPTRRPGASGDWPNPPKAAIAKAGKSRGACKTGGSRAPYA